GGHGRVRKGRQLRGRGRGRRRHDRPILARLARAAPKQIQRDAERHRTSQFSRYDHSPRGAYHFGGRSGHPALSRQGIVVGMSSDPQDSALAIHRWLMDQPRGSDDSTAFMRALAARLGEAGVPLWRIRYALMTMHPEVLWRTVQWRAGGDVMVRDQHHELL